MYCDTIHFFVLEDVLCPCEKSLFWLWCVVWFGPDEGTRDGTIWERTSDRRRRKKRLRQNMWAINTHLSRKTEQWWKWRAERLTGTGRLRVKVKMIERQVRGGGGPGCTERMKGWKVDSCDETKDHKKDSETSLYQTHVDDSPWGPPAYTPEDKRWGNEPDDQVWKDKK